MSYGHDRQPTPEELQLFMKTLLGMNRQERKALLATGRNDPCPCGSGDKFKACCKPKLDAKHTEHVPSSTVTGYRIAGDGDITCRACASGRSLGRLASVRCKRQRFLKVNGKYTCDQATRRAKR